MSHEVLRAKRLSLIAFVCCCFAVGIQSPVTAQHRVILQGNDKLAMLSDAAKPEWEMKWGGIHDIHVLSNGHVMVQQGAAKVAEIDPRTKQVVWSYDSAKENGNAGKPVEVHA